MSGKQRRNTRAAKFPAEIHPACPPYLLRPAHLFSNKSSPLSVTNAGLGREGSYAYDSADTISLWMRSSGSQVLRRQDWRVASPVTQVAGARPHLKKEAER